MRSFVIGILFVLSGVVSAQQNDKLVESLQVYKDGEGIIIINDEEGVKELVDIQVEVNSRMGGVDGYRIQLYSGSGPKGKRKALDIKGKFLSKFPDYDIDLSFTSPFWRVRVGNYRHKHEALPLMNEIKDMFPNSYIVKDGNVKMSKF